MELYLLFNLFRDLVLKVNTFYILGYLFSFLIIIIQDFPVNCVTFQSDLVTTSAIRLIDFVPPRYNGCHPSISSRSLNLHGLYKLTPYLVEYSDAPPKEIIDHFKSRNMSADCPLYVESYSASLVIKPEAFFHSNFDFLRYRTRENSLVGSDAVYSSFDMQDVNFTDLSVQIVSNEEVTLNIECLDPPKFKHSQNIVFHQLNNSFVYGNRVEGVIDDTILLLVNDAVTHTIQSNCLLRDQAIVVNLGVKTGPQFDFGIKIHMTMSANFVFYGEKKRRLVSIMPYNQGYMDEICWYSDTRSGGSYTCSSTAFNQLGCVHDSVVWRGVPSG
jgi:hypothetical protein